MSKINPQQAKDILRKHFLNVTEEGFKSNIHKYGSDSEQEIKGAEDLCWQEEKHMSQLVLFQPQPYPQPLKLQAYLASALTGLSEVDRQLVFHISDTIATVCSTYDIEVYEPRKSTDPVHHPEVPDADVFRKDRDRVLESDLLILLTHYPSFGAGEEIDFAYNALVPILIISHSTNRVSRMVTGIPTYKLEIKYTEPEDLRQELSLRLPEIRPVLEERKLAFSAYDSNIVGQKIKLLRESIGLTWEDIVKGAPLLSVDQLRQMETATDRQSNPSLLQLRQIAAILKTTVADLVEPDLSQRLLITLQEWIEGKAAARFGNINVKDRNKILRRLLLRLLDSLEE